MNELESFTETLRARITPVPNLQLKKSLLGGKGRAVLISSIELRDPVLPRLKQYDQIGNFLEIGSFWGAVGGLFIGSAFFEVPGDGPLLAAFGGAVLFGGVSAVAGFFYNGGFFQATSRRPKKLLKQKTLLPIPMNLFG